MYLLNNKKSEMPNKKKKKSEISISFPDWERINSEWKKKNCIFSQEKLKLSNLNMAGFITGTWKTFLNAKESLEMPGQIT
jgi:hypothetical protein